MLRAIQILGAGNFQKEIVLAVKSTVDFLIDLQFESGNIPSSLNKKKEDKLIHFCHGPTGAVPLFLSAHAHFQEEKYLTAALDCGEAIWHRGLILKGNGLCHGITGNIYPFLNLGKYTKDAKWKTRAYQFAVLSFNKEVIDMVK